MKIFNGLEYNKKIRIGTRASALALYQANLVSKALRRMGFETELVTITTSGDKFYKTPLEKIGGKGLFIKEIEEALIAGKIDIAVHSLKDMPVGVLPEGLVFSAFLKREDARDVYIPKAGADASLNSEKKLIIGTASLRREAQLRLINNNFTSEPMRGNVNTRVEKLDDGQFDAIVLAYAGILRLGIKRKGMMPLNKDIMVPSPGQGTIVVESRKKDPLNKVFEKINHKETEICSMMERKLTYFIGKSCYIPFGANLEKNGDILTARVFLQWKEKNNYLKIKMVGAWKNREKMAAKIKKMIDLYIS